MDTRHPAFQKDTHTLLIPDLFPVHMELLADAIRASGYRAQILRNQGPAVLDVSLRYLHNDLCYPAICSLGQQLHAVTSGDYDTDAIALLQFQTGGGCRASNYAMALKKALQKLGLDHIPVVTVGFTTLSRGSGFALTPLLCLRALAAVTFGDLMMLLKNQVRPYEANPGDTQAVMDRWYGLLKEKLATPFLFPGMVRGTLHRMAADFAALPSPTAEGLKHYVIARANAL